MSSLFGFRMKKIDGPTNLACNRACCIRVLGRCINETRCPPLNLHLMPLGACARSRARAPALAPSCRLSRPSRTTASLATMPRSTEASRTASANDAYQRKLRKPWLNRKFAGRLADHAPTAMEIAGGIARREITSQNIPRKAIASKRSCMENRGCAQRTCARAQIARKDSSGGTHTRKQNCT